LISEVQDSGYTLADILIHSEDPSQHTEAVQEVLERLRMYRLYAKLSKCVFDTDTVEFLGFIVDPTAVKMDPTRIETI